MFKLRPYQQSFKAAIAEAWRRVRVVMAILATGGGKTVVFASIIHDHNGGSAAVVHRKEIVSQISVSLAHLEVKHRIIAPPSVIRRIRRRHLRFIGKCYVDQHALCGVASVQTLTSPSAANNKELQSWAAQVTLAVFDEGHHYTDSGKWAKAVHLLEQAKMLFVTATPDRADGKGLGVKASGFIEEMIEGPTTKWLIDNGYLSPYKYFAPDSDLDVSDLAVTASGDFNSKALRARVVDSHLIGDVVSHYENFAAGKRFIVFNTDVATAEETAQAFRAEGVICEALSGKTDGAIRDKELDKFESGENTGLANVDLFDEGFDVPAVEVCAIARPTQSVAKFLQMVGRSLRPVYAKGFDLATKAGRLAAIAAGPKTHAIIIDPVRNWERHGMPDWPRVWSLADRPTEARNSVSDTIPQKVCIKCTQPYEAYYKVCPYCGYAPEPIERSAPAFVDGDLFELNVEALAALFAERQAADMTDEEYQLDMVARKVPQIGRPAGLRRHKSAKYRRTVLHNLVGWWLGVQPTDRDMSEKYRRFYLRFGVDMSTAFTLNQKDTDALIVRITRGFNYDIN